MSGELHPFVLHFAVGLLLTAPMCDGLGLALRRESLLYTARWATIFGAIWMVLAVLTGLTARAALGPHSAAGEALLRLHDALSWVMLAVWLPLAAWRGMSRLALPLRARTLYLAMSFAGGALVIAQAVLGATLVYRHGVGLSPGARAEPVVHGVSRGGP